MAALIGAHFDAGHGEIDARQEVLDLDVGGRLLQARGWTFGVEAAPIQRLQLLAGGIDQALDGFGKRPGADRRPVVVAETHPPTHEVIGKPQVVGVAGVQPGDVQRRGVGKGQIADRVEIGQDNEWIFSNGRGLKRRAGRDGDKERAERPHAPRPGNVDLVLVVVQVKVAASARGQVEEIP